MKFQRCWNYIQQRRIHSVPIILSCIYDLVYRGGNIYVFARDSSAPSLSPFKLYFVHPIANVKVNEQIIFLKFLFPSINRLSTKQLYRSEISAYLTPGFEGWDGRKSRRDISRERFQREKLAGKLASSPSPPPQFRFSHNLSLTMMLPPHRQLFPLLQSEEISGGRPFSRPSVDIPREKRTASVSVSRILADEETRRSRLSLELTFPPPANNYHHHHHHHPRRRVRRKFTRRRRRRRRRRFSSPCNRPSSRKLKRCGFLRKCSGIQSSEMRERLREHCFSKDSIIFVESSEPEKGLRWCIVWNGSPIWDSSFFSSFLLILTLDICMYECCYT